MRREGMSPDALGRFDIGHERSAVGYGVKISDVAGPNGALLMRFIRAAHF
jgi:hypothetical protein